MRRSGRKAARSSVGGTEHGGYKVSFDAKVQKPPEVKRKGERDDMRESYGRRQENKREGRRHA